MNSKNHFQTTKRHHYVWQKYLSAWTTRRKLACIRAGKVFSVSTANVAVERYFYRTVQLSPDERKFAEALMGGASPVLTDLHKSWLDTLCA